MPAALRALVLASAVTHGEAWATFSAFNQAFTGV
jgi:hypothetical protein